MQQRTLYEVIGESVLLASVQIGLVTIEMSSKFDILNANSQVALQDAADSLSSYLTIAIIWTIGSVLLLYGHFGILGLISGIIINILFILWITIGYLRIFKTVSEKNGLTYPIFFC